MIKAEWTKADALDLQPTCNQLATDCISRQAAIKAIDDLPNCYNGYSDTYDKAYIIGVLEELPSAVKRGRWELAEDGWYCSACELYPPFDCDPEEKGIPFCPWCGAKMDEVGR